MKMKMATTVVSVRSKWRGQIGLIRFYVSWILNQVRCFFKLIKMKI